MAYCTYSDIQKLVPESELIQLSSDDVQALTPDKDYIESVISDVDTFIDGYLRSRYSLPLNPASDITKEIAKEIVLYRMYKKRNRQDALQSRFDIAIKTLESIQKGKITLESGDSTAKPSFVKYKESSQVFTDDELSMY